MNISKYVISLNYNDKLFLFNTKNNLSVSITSDLLEKADKDDKIFNDMKKFLSSKHFFVEKNELQKATTLFKKQNEERLKISIFSHADCNFRCKYCYEKFEPHGIIYNETILIAFIDNLLKKGKYKLLDIDWFGGEPLLGYQSILDISSKLQKLVAKKGIKYTSNITTNGFLLTENRLKSLVEDANIRIFQVTIDGDAIGHDSQRILRNMRGSFSTILSNLTAFKNSDLKATIIIRMNISKNNYDSVKRFLNNEGQIFRNDERFLFVFRNVGDWGIGERKSDYNVPLCEEDASFDMSCTAIDLGYHCADVILGTNNRYECYAQQKNSYAIDTYGNILKCTVDLYSNKNKIGCITDEKMNISHEKESIWLNTYKFDSKCTECPYVLICKHGYCAKKIINKETTSDIACAKSKLSFAHNFELAARQNNVMFELS